MNKNINMKLHFSHLMYANLNIVLKVVSVREKFIDFFLQIIAISCSFTENIFFYIDIIL